MKANTRRNNNGAGSRKTRYEFYCYSWIADGKVWTAAPSNEEVATRKRWLRQLRCCCKMLTARLTVRLIPCGSRLILARYIMIAFLLPQCFSLQRPHGYSFALFKVQFSVMQCTALSWALSRVFVVVVVKLSWVVLVKVQLQGMRSLRLGSFCSLFLLLLLLLFILNFLLFLHYIVFFLRFFFSTEFFVFQKNVATEVLRFIIIIANAGVEFFVVVRCICCWLVVVAAAIMITQVA